MIIFIGMNVDELINNYFNLSVEEKEQLLCVLVKKYFTDNLEIGYSVLEIINGVDDVIENSIRQEDYEMSQAFKDIKDAMKVAIKEMNIHV
jgi:hypothetical protein